MVTDLVLVFVLSFFGFVAAFLPRSVFPIRGFRFANVGDDAAFLLVTQIAGALFLLLAYLYLHQLIYGYM